MLKKDLKKREKIRIYMRSMRKSLSFSEKNHESIKISRIALNFDIINNAKKIGIFLPFDGEINTYPLILKLWLNKKKIFLPKICSFHHKKLLFIHFQPNSILFFNKYKILEPVFKYQNVISIDNLDIVIVPLVALDREGTRLGMGGGFYDSVLKNWKQRNFIPIGFSYNFQLVHSIPKQFWDVSLPILLTPNKIWFF